MVGNDDIMVIRHGHRTLRSKLGRHKQTYKPTIGKHFSVNMVGEGIP